MERPRDVPESDTDSCIYCGGSERITRDHIPPKCLFPKPRATDLITVPACQNCNAGFADDDEYFRFAMVTASFEHPAGRKLWQDSVVPRTFKRHPALIRGMVKTVRTVELKSASGLYLGKAPVIPFGRRRINRVIRRIRRGLNWHHFERLAPSDKEILVVSNPKPLSLAVQSVLKDATRLGKVGDGSIFAYRYAYVPSQPEASSWILQFYSRLNFIGLSIPDDLQDEVGVTAPG